jgi:hypothetical protein
MEVNDSPLASSRRNKDLFRKFEDKFKPKPVNGENKPSVLDRIKKHDSSHSKSKEKYSEKHSKVEKKRETKEKTKKYSSKDFFNVEEEDIEYGGYGADEGSTKQHISKFIGYI